MATPVSDAVPLDDDEFISGLVQGSAWQFSGAPILTYSLNINDDGFGNPGPGGNWTPELSAAVAQAFQAWSNVANLTFQQVTSGTYYYESTADISITLTGDELQQSGLLALGIFPDPEYVDQLGIDRSEYPNPEGDIAFDNYSTLIGTAVPGSSGFYILLHEIGHALGLKHTDDDGANARPTFSELGISQYDSVTYTIMGSGVEPTGPYAISPLLLDILAIQHIYGANTNYNTGNDTYPVRTDVRIAIWDAGGIDTLDASQIASGATVDLRAGAFSGVGSGMTTAIAYNVVIEKALGGAGSDDLIGNSAANVLDGGGGADWMTGLGGNDTYVVDDPGDIVVEQANEGTDRILTSVSFNLNLGPIHVENVTLTGSADVNATGNELDNVLAGNGGSNVLRGQAGKDSLDGRAGNDTLDGGASADQLFGGGGSDRLVGAGGQDTLDGGSGADTMLGGLGNDTYIVNVAGDVVAEAPDEGADTVLSSVSYTLTANVERLALTGASNLIGTGNELANVLTGNEGNDRLNGGGGGDTLDGGAGNDTLSGGASRDLLLGGGQADSLVGAGGHDTLDGGNGADTMAGGEGNDTYVVNVAGDEVAEAPDQGTDMVLSAITYQLPVNVENLMLTGLSNVNGTGNDLDNTLIGNDGVNKLNGGVGADTLDGGAGSDTLLGASRNDTLVYDASDAVVDGGTGTDRLRIDGSGVALDLPGLAGTTIKNIEIVDLTGTGNNTLMVSLADVLAISDSTDTLRVDGNAGDVLIAMDAGSWTQESDQTIGSTTYHGYAQGMAQLLVDTDLTISV
jgi:Ca2+-binding RTX toxin-like protein